MRRETVLLVNVVMALVLFGVLMVYSAGTVREFTHTDGYGLHSLKWLWKTLAYAAVGLACMTLAARFDYHRFRRRIVLWPLMGVMFGLLVAVLFVGVEINGARRWLAVGGQTFQPSDFAKMALIIVLAVKLAEGQETVRSFRRGFVPPMLLAFLVAILVGLERNVGDPVIIGAVALLMLHMAGARLWHLALSVAPGAALVTLYIWLNPHAQARLYSYREPWRFQEAEGFNLFHSLWAFARGGIEGLGPGAGLGKLRYIYAAQSDFIFAVVGEELGLAGTLTLVALFVAFVVLGMRVAVCAPDILGALLAGGITTLIGLQAALNMAVATGLLPTKGLTLPFISAGGTALIIYMTMAGILINVAWQARDPEPAERRRTAPARPVHARQ
jgi:cell division protein FtsW